MVEWRYGLYVKPLIGALCAAVGGRRSSASVGSEEVLIQATIYAGF